MPKTGERKKVKKVLGWEARIKAAVKRGGFTEKDVALSDMWQTCAVGEQPMLKKYSLVPHENDDLWLLGDDFNQCVRRHDPRAALLKLRVIRKRAKALLAEARVGAKLSAQLERELSRAKAQILVPR